MIAIVDFGMGNLRSIQYKLEKRKLPTVIATRPEIVARAEKIILPGVGHFAAGMKNLHETGFVDVLNQKVLVEKVPILGICLGMQLFTKQSEEGHVAGLGWLNAQTKRFSFADGHRGLRIPHVGWNTIQMNTDIPLMKGVDVQAHFYFAHSYHVQCDDPGLVLATTSYGYDFVSMLQKENIIGIQFHPEKSHRNGFKIIENFFTLYNNA